MPDIWSVGCTCYFSCKYSILLIIGLRHTYTYVETYIHTSVYRSSAKSKIVKTKPWPQGWAARTGFHPHWLRLILYSRFVLRSRRVSGQFSYVDHGGPVFQLISLAFSFSSIDLPSGFLLTPLYLVCLNMERSIKQFSVPSPRLD